MSDELDIFSCDLPIVDRSTAQKWADCPHQAAHVFRGNVSDIGTLGVIGTAVHEITSFACQHRADGESQYNVKELMLKSADTARTDIQPHVIYAMRSSAYKLAEFLCMRDNGVERHPDDLIRFDGGKDERSGQISYDLRDGDGKPIARCTCELDLLLACESIEEVEITDFKSGWRYWTAGDVLESFQFGWQAWLTFQNYPAVNRVHIRVFCMREARLTGRVTFYRENMGSLHARIFGAIEGLLKWKDADIESIPAWPTPEKCAICPASSRCIEAHRPNREVSADPIAAMLQLAAMDSRVSELQSALVAHVEATGEEIFDEATGTFFGPNKPKDRERRPSFSLYQIPRPKAATAKPLPAPKSTKAIEREPANVSVPQQFIDKMKAHVATYAAPLADRFAADASEIAKPRYVAKLNAQQAADDWIASQDIAEAEILTPFASDQAATEFLDNLSEPGTVPAAETPNLFGDKSDGKGNV